MVFAVFSRSTAKQDAAASAAAVAASTETACDIAGEEESAPIVSAGWCGVHMGDDGSDDDGTEATGDVAAAAAADFVLLGLTSVVLPAATTTDTVGVCALAKARSTATRAASVASVTVGSF